MLGPPLRAQRDANMLFGYGDDPDEGLGLYNLRWHRGTTRLEPFGPHPFDGRYFLAGTSTLSASDGRLLLYSNGCDVREPTGELVEGSRFLADDILTEERCHGDLGGPDYTALQVHLLVPGPEAWGDSVVYAVRHATVDTDSITFESQALLAHRLARRRGRYVVTSRDTLHAGVSAGTHLTATPVAGGAGYWIPTVDLGSNRWRLWRVGDGAETYAPAVVSATGPTLEHNSFETAQMAFSPDNRWFAVNTTDHGVVVYRFDAITGRLTHHSTIPYRIGNLVLPHNFWDIDGLGTAFSPSSELLYVTRRSYFESDTWLAQIDLTLLDAGADAVEALAALTEIYHLPGPTMYRNWPSLLGTVYSGPDCMLYMASSNTNFNYHVIVEPDRRGPACDFRRDAFEAPIRHLRLLPNFPNYRAVSGCDPTYRPLPGLERVVGLTEGPPGVLTLAPNPVRAGATARVTLAPAATAQVLTIVDLHGRSLVSAEVAPGVDQMPIPTAGLPPGVYFVRIAPAAEPDARAGQTTVVKLVVIE